MTVTGGTGDRFAVGVSHTQSMVGSVVFIVTPGQEPVCGIDQYRLQGRSPGQFTLVGAVQGWGMRPPLPMHFLRPPASSLSPRVTSPPPLPPRPHQHLHTPPYSGLLGRHFIVMYGE